MYFFIYLYIQVVNRHTLYLDIIFPDKYLYLFFPSISLKLNRTFPTYICSILSTILCLFRKLTKQVIDKLNIILFLFLGRLYVAN